MGNFQRGNRSGYSDRGFDRNRGGGRSFSRPGLDRPQMYRATCANCGNECEVPFRPTGSKPVLCNNCFGKNSERDSSASRRSFSDRDARVRTSFNDRPMYDAICTNCGNSCKIPFEPKEGREILCSDCFEVRNGVAPRQSSRMNSRSERSDRPERRDQIEILNQKLDKILELLGAKDMSKPVKKKTSKAEPSVQKEKAGEVTSDVTLETIEEIATEVLTGATEDIPEIKKKAPAKKKAAKKKE